MAFSSIETGLAGSVISWILALPSSTALHGGIEHARGCTESDVTEFALTWYIRPSLLMMVFRLPCRSVPFLLYLTLKPKLALLPGSPAFRMSPASESYAESPTTAVMSWMVALSITVAVLDVADAVEANNVPVYVTRASSLVTMKSCVIERGTPH